MAMVRYLLDNGALVKLRNNHGWSSLAESISYGNRDIIMALWQTYKARSRDEVKRRTPEIMEKITVVGDFHLSINW
jgi:ankyrin repeat protein